MKVDRSLTSKTLWIGVQYYRLGQHTNKFPLAREGTSLASKRLSVFVASFSVIRSLAATTPLLTCFRGYPI